MKNKDVKEYLASIGNEELDEIKTYIEMLQKRYRDNLNQGTPL